MIVCEVGLNHLGNEAYSTQYIDKLCKTKCNAITYQIRENEFYNNDNFLNSKLPITHYNDLVDKSHENNKKFGIALANHSLIEKCESIGVDFYKVLSWDFNNYDFINKLLDTKKTIYVSTGMSNLDEIIKFNDYYSDSDFVDQIILIHTQLSVDIGDVNLKVINYLKKSFSFPIAYGHHCANMNVIYAASVMEPSDLFFYIKGSETHKHPDEDFAIFWDDLPEFIDNINELNVALGSETKIKMENYIDKENIKK